ncbi:gephyrin-like molybdotransferase Glp [Actinobaculum sp. 313]|uniref:molybdopterin-binding protein n=1 Tax=Actinobaculum sp. 313 TaxID=2495645 RepID=UPI000D5267DA|nr:gephyrin-like molybdotransferase Glp [Actinobaculum sp. 313]AWE41595.1 molybdopterin molybdenumtransferase MoeA [Actinobaculum sp. 313]
MKEVAQHFADVLSLGRPLAVTEVPLAQARGLTLGADVPARLPIPPFTNSAMDGFAIRAADVHPGISLPVVGDIPAGATTPPRLRPGTALRIMTGAPLPPGADAVLQVELTENPSRNMRADPPPQIVPTAVITAGMHIRRAGEDVVAGATAFHAGTVLTPAHLSALAALGYASAPVHTRPRVGVLTTGDELRAPGADLLPGQIPDSNSLLVAQLVEEHDAVARVHHWAGDEPTAFSADLDELAMDVDLILTTGGVSAGAFDVVKAALAHRGVLFEKVGMQPGKPQGWGVLQAGGATAMQRRSVPILCLPGNPVSVFVSMQLFALPLLDKLLGRAVTPYEEMFQPARAAAGWERKPGRVQFLPCVRVATKVGFPEGNGADYQAGNYTENQAGSAAKDGTEDEAKQAAKGGMRDSTETPANGPVEGTGGSKEIPGLPRTAPAEEQSVTEDPAVAVQIAHMPRIAPATSGGSGSHLIGSLPLATGLARVAADRACVAAGDDVDVLWLKAQRR